MTGGTSNGKLGLADEEQNGQPMQVYLSKPAGQREGPFSVDQINRDLAAKKYKDTDYWAWYDGLSQWVPLHAVPGVLAPGRPGPAAAAHAPQPKKASTPAQTAAADNIEQLFTRKPAPTRGAQEVPGENLFSRKPAANQKAAATPEPRLASTTAATSEPAKFTSDPSGKGDVASGLPFAALEQIFIFTTGDSRSVLQSPVVAGMLQDVVGEELSTIRTRVGRDVIGNCDFGERVRRDGAIPEAAWKAMASLKPEVVRFARDGTFRACIRTFTTGAKEVVALFLFYNKQKM